MSFFKKIFGKGEQENQLPETDGSTYIKQDKGSYILNKDALPKYSYTPLSEKDDKVRLFCVEIFRDKLATAFKFSAKPANHPQNLDEYLIHWFQADFGDFLGIGAEQHAAFLAYNFGQYLVDTYNMKWFVKSDESGGTQTVVRIQNPVEIELYPIDSTLRAIKDKEMSLYVNIDNKLKNALKQFSK